MKNERVTRREVLQAVRGSGSSSMDDVAAVILETDGTISVIGAAEGTATPKRNELFDSVKRNPEA